MAEMFGPPYVAALIRNEDKVVENLLEVSGQEDLFIFAPFFPDHLLLDAKGQATMGGTYNQETGAYLPAPSPEPEPPTEGVSNE